MTKVIFLGLLCNSPQITKLVYIVIKQYCWNWTRYLLLWCIWYV